MNLKYKNERKYEFYQEQDLDYPYFLSTKPCDRFELRKPGRPLDTDWKKSTLD